MNKLDLFTNQEIAKMLIFETKERGEEILKEKFPEEKNINIRTFSNGDAFVTIGERKIEIKAKKVV